MKGFRYGFGFVPNYIGVLSGGIPVDTPNALPAGLPFSLGGTAPPVTTYNVNSATLNGSTSYIEAPAPVASAFDILTQSFSANIWIKTTQTTTGMIVNCDGDGSLAYWDCYVQGTELLFRVGADLVKIGNQAKDGNWHLLTVVKDNDINLSQGGFTGEFRIYLDGVEQTLIFIDRRTNCENLNASTASDPITFGRRSYTNSQYFDGSLSFASIHVGTALGVSDALAEYNTGIPKCLEDSPNNATITEAWDLSNYTGSIGSLVGLNGVQNLTTETAITYTDQGLQVEC